LGLKKAVEMPGLQLAETRKESIQQGKGIVFEISFASLLQDKRITNCLAEKVALPSSLLQKSLLFPSPSQQCLPFGDAAL
jgi:hypothetical protein